MDPLRKKRAFGRRKRVFRRRRRRVFSTRTRSSESCIIGVWSIRDDLQVPLSPYFPAYAQGQGPPLVSSSNILYRIIRCGGAVDDDMANIIVAQLLYLDAVDPTKDIVMYVNSPGGSVTAGMAIFDTMRHIRPDVSTVCVGLAASMGAFLLSAGTKGKRYNLPNSRIMIHQPLGGAQGGPADIDIQANEMLHHKGNLNGYLAYHTGQSLEKINQDTDRVFFMSAKEVKEYGLIDGVIMNPLKALQPPRECHEYEVDAELSLNQSESARNGGRFEEEEEYRKDSRGALLPTYNYDNEPFLNSLFLVDQTNSSNLSVCFCNESS